MNFALSIHVFILTCPSLGVELLSIVWSLFLDMDNSDQSETEIHNQSFHEECLTKLCRLCSSRLLTASKKKQIPSTLLGTMVHVSGKRPDWTDISPPRSKWPIFLI